MKKILLVIVIILVLTTGLIYYLYTRISYTPDWYDKGQFAVDKEMITQSKGTEESITAELIRNKRTVVNAEDLTAFILEEVHRQIPEESDQVMKALRCEVEGGQVLIESVINLDEIPLKKLSPTQQNAVKKLLGSFPEDSRQNFYIGISGRPVLNDERIELGPEAKVQLGKMKYPLNSILAQISGKNQPATFVPLNKFPFKNFHIEGDKIILENED